MTFIEAFAVCFVGGLVGWWLYGSFVGFALGGGATAFLLVMAIALAVRRKRKMSNGGVSSAPILLGQQLADARAVEDARLAAGSQGPSPMPDGDYDKTQQGPSLAVTAPIPLDDDIRSLARSFTAWDEARRGAARNSISMEEQYVLFHFARRAAVLSRNEGTPEWAADGLRAVAMIDEKRIDPRDASWAVGVLAWAIDSTGGNRAELFAQAAAVATPGMAEILRRGDRKTQLSDWGFAEVRTDAGLGLIQSGFGKYEPSIDLTTVALRVADVLSEGKYFGSVEIRSEVPEIWFAESHRKAAKKKLKQARAAASIRGVLKEPGDDPSGMQMLLMWLVELRDAETAEWLAADAAGRSSDDGRFTVGIAEGNLFLLLIGGSWAVGVEPLESPDSLTELAEAFRPVLKRASA